MIKVEKIQIPALPTEKPRRLYIYLPKDYDRTDRRYPVLYMFDGHNVFYNSHATYGRSWGMKEYLERTKLPLILVAVECNPEGHKRLSEYTPWSFTVPELGTVEAKGEATMDYFVNQLKPRIDAEYRTLPDREHTLVAGSSMGGVMALYAVTAYNSVFSRAAALSPCLWLEPKRMAELIRTAKLEEKTLVYTDMGGGEVEGHIRPLTALFETAKRLTRSGAYVDARTVHGAMHNEAAWEKRIPVFMDFLLGRAE